MGQILTFGPSSIRARRRRPRSMFYDQGVSSNPAEKLLKEALVWLQSSGIEGESGEDAGNNVIAWRNSGTGGSAYDLTATVGSPTVVQYRGNKAVNFSGVNDMMRPSSPVNIPQPFTIIFVGAMGSPQSATGFYAMDGYGSTNRCSLFAAVTWRMFAGVSVQLPTQNSSGNHEVVQCVYSGANSMLRTLENGESLVPSTVGTNSLDWISLANRYVPQSTSESFNGPMSDVVLFNRALTLSERDLIEGYFK